METIKNTEEKRKRGRPVKYKPELLKDAYELARLGFTERELCTYWNICDETLRRWKRKNPQLNGALEKGRLEANISATKALFNAVQKGNLTAIIFWLTNRCPELWSDRRAVVQNTIVNRQGGNGDSINPEDKELQQRIQADLQRLLP